MFGVIPAGQPPNTNPQAISQTQFAFNLSPPFNHVVVFLLPGTQLPEGSAVGVYCQLADDSNFRFLGALSNQKQSAIFKINAGSNTGGQQNSGMDDVMLDDATLESIGEPSTAPAGGIVLGISVEAVAGVEAQLTTLRAAQANQGNTSASSQLVRRNAMAAPIGGSPLPTKVLAQRIIQNAFNFLGSFGDTVPLKSFQDWWTKFEKRIDLDPGFLEREAGA